MNGVIIESGITNTGKVKIKVLSPIRAEYSLARTSESGCIVNLWLTGTCVNIANAAKTEAAIDILHELQHWITEGGV